MQCSAVHCRVQIERERERESLFFFFFVNFFCYLSICASQMDMCEIIYFNA